MKTYTQIISLVLFCLGSFYIFRPDEYTFLDYVTTDYARVEGIEVHLAPAYEGYIQDFHLREGDVVKAGDRLLSVYNSQLDAEIDVVHSKIKLLEKNSKGLFRLVDRSANLTAMRKGSVQIQENYIQVVEKESARIKTLVENQLSPTSDADRLQKDLLASQLKRADIDVDLLISDLKDHELEYQAIENQSLLAVEQRHLNKLLDLKQKLTVAAEFDGRVSRIHARNGAWVDKGENIVSIINEDDRWIVAHFKESTLHELYIGQKVLIHLDSYPELVFNGVITSFQPQTTANKNIFPFEKTAGSFIKVTQRIPVNIAFSDDIDVDLIIGQSAVIKALRRRAS